MHCRFIGHKFKFNAWQATTPSKWILIIIMILTCTWACMKDGLWHPSSRSTPILHMFERTTQVPNHIRYELKIKTLIKKYLSLIDSLVLPRYQRLIGAPLKQWPLLQLVDRRRFRRALWFNRSKARPLCFGPLERSLLPSYLIQGSLRKLMIATVYLVGNGLYVCLKSINGFGRNL